MKTVQFYYAGLLSALLVSGSAHAQWTLGAGMVSTDPNYRGLSRDTIAIPFIGYEGERFYFRGIEAGYRLNDNRQHQFSALVTAAPFRFRPNENRDPQLSQLDKRNFSAELALDYRYRSMLGELGARVGQDVRGNGHRLTASYSYPLSRSPQQWNVAPRVGLSYISAGYTDYYYGVSATEAARTGLPEYSSQDAINPFIGVTGYYRFNQRMSVFATINSSRISSKIANSPMADGSSVNSIVMALTYSL